MRRLESQLVPYTTLFRSGNGAADLVALDLPAHHQQWGRKLLGVSGAVLDGRVRGDRDLLAVFAGEVLHDRVPLDRKSTRLNSSHVSISYAVFCLKKKTKA